MQHAPEPVEIADGQRVVEMQLGVQIRDDAWIALLAREHDCRISGQQLLQPEDHHADEQQRRNDRREPPGEERRQRQLNFKPCTRTSPSGTVRKPESRAV